MVCWLASVMLVQVALSVVAVLRDVVCRVGDRRQTVGIVIGVGCRLVVLVGGRDASPGKRGDRRKTWGQENVGTDGTYPDYLFPIWESQEPTHAIAVCGLRQAC